MKEILVLGGGGVGTMAAVNLQCGQKAAVTMVLRSNYNRAVEDGYHITSVDHGEIVGWRPTTVLNRVPEHTGKPFDFVVVTTKNIPDAYPTVVDLIRPAIVPGKTVIVLIQNGYNIEKPIFEAFPQNKCLSGVSMITCRELELGVIDQDGEDQLAIGAFCNPNLSWEDQVQTAHEFVDIYSAGGKTNCNYDADFNFSRWRKLVNNACLNTICALTDLDTGRIRLAGGLVDNLIRPAMQEVLAAARACGVTLPDDLIDFMLEADPLDLYIAPSMLEDARKGNLVEVEVILGEPLREGLARNIPMPNLTVVYHLLKALQWGRLEKRGAIEIPPKRVC